MCCSWSAGDVMSGSVGGGDEHAGVLRELFGARWWTGREFVLLVTAAFVLLPLVLRRSVGEFTFQLAPYILVEYLSNNLVEIKTAILIRTVIAKNYSMCEYSTLQN